MMGTEDKTLFCFCHWGWTSKVLPDGSTSYVGGVTRQVIAKTGIKYNDFVNAVFGRLGFIDPSDMILHFTVKFDRSQLIDLKDQEDVNSLLQFNDGFAHVYASSLEEPNSRPPSGGVKKVELIFDSESKPDTTPAGDDENDKKCGVSKAAAAKQPSHQVNRNPFVRQNNVHNGFNAPFNNPNHRQSTQPASSAVQETFWTECHSCKVRYQYYSNYVNSALRCQKCSKLFIAFDIGSQGVPPGPNWSQPAFQDVPLKSNLNQSFVQKELANQGTSKMTAGSAGFPPTRTGPQQGPEICRGKTAPVFEDMRTKRKDGKRTGGMREGAAMPKVDCKSRKRGRKQIIESSESSDTSTSVETEDAEIENGNNPQGPEICRGKTAPVFEDMRTKWQDGKRTGGMREGAAMPKVDRKSRKRGRKQIIESSESSDTSTSVETEDVEIENGNNPQGPEICRGKTASVFEDMRTKRKDGKRTGGMSEGAAMPKVDRKSRKRGRKQIIESSESSDTSTSVETEDVEIENGNNPQGPEICRGKTAPVFEDITTNGKDEKLPSDMKGVAMPKVDCKSRKRSRKQTVESSERDDTSISVETEDVEIENGNSPPAGQGTGLDAYGARWQPVSCNEGVSDDKNDLTSPLKKAQSDQSAGDSNPLKKAWAHQPASKHQQKEAVGVCRPEGGVQNNNSKIGTVNDSDSEPDAVPGIEPSDEYDYPDPEFSNFDMHKAENCFAVDQTWACYDSADCMPRFYALITKVSSPEFKIKLRWLEAHPEDQRERTWVRAELPVGCGKFRRASSEYTSDRLIFSHQVHCEKDEQGLYIVYPRKGEMWALFRDWDTDWSSNPMNHRKYKYEIVEILSDFVGDVGIQVGYLDKVTGFVGIFQRTWLHVAGTFFVKPSELYKFSHRIPSKMSGTVREGVPAGSFELDPSCLPLNPDDIWYPGKVKEDRKTAKSAPAVNVLSPGPPVTRDKSRNAMTSLKSGDLNGIHCTDGESAKVGSSKNPIALPDKDFEVVVCDFKMNRSMKKFKVDQVWALYGQNSTLPKTYAQIKKIVPSPFKLHVVLLEASAGHKNAPQAVCGTFKVQNEKVRVVDPSTFSHVVKAVSNNRNRFEIYPRKGEIWALYKNWKKSGLDPDKLENEIVEIIENSKDGINVSSMVRVNGFKSVFGCPGKHRLNSAILEIKKDELGRFSHQIPAFQLTGEKGGVLRGCWELDPASVPCSL